jgi:hypothetical protein
METQQQKFLRTRKENEGKLATKIVTAPTGQMFELRILDPMDIAQLFERVGIDLAKIKEMPQEEIGSRLLANAKTIIDEFIVPMVVEPRLLPSTADPAAAVDGVPVGWLYGVEKSFLLNKLFEIAVGKEGMAVAESFQGKPMGEAGGAPRPDVRRPTE